MHIYIFSHIYTCTHIYILIIYTHTHTHTHTPHTHTYVKVAPLISQKSGTEYGVTLGTPISLFVPNEDQRPKDYSTMNQFPRPSHADFTYQVGE